MKTFYILTAAVIALGVASCSNLLEVEAENTISGDVLTDGESIQSALTGAYYNFSGISDGGDGGELMGGDFILIPELMGRLSSNTIQEYRWQSVLAPTAYLEFVNKTILANNDRVAANWRRAFETFNTVNSILAVIDRVEDPNERTRIQGEALAMRGILLYEMVVLWGPHYEAPGVNPATDLVFPFTTDPILEISEIPRLTPADRKTVDQIYDQAEADLTTASSLLEPFGKNGTNLSHFACQAYLAKLYLQKGEYGDAADAADAVIASGEFSLAPTPMEAFNNPSNSSEDIFAIQQTLTNNVGDRSTGGGLTAYYSSLSESGLGVLGILEASFTSSFFINPPNFSEDDLRGTVNTDVDENTQSSQITTAYYQNIANNFAGLLSTAKYTSSLNVLPIIRLAEMYLIRAEATYYELGGTVTPQCISDLNAIRERAGIAPVALTDFADPELFFDSLALERTREFMHEGMILEDLKRWGGYVGSDLSPNLEYDPWDERFIFPIPQSETDTWGD